MVREALKDLAIDDMRDEDIPEILGIAAASFAVPWSETSFFNQIHNPRSISRVARSGNRIAGYICASHILDEGHILDIAVVAGFRNRGTGNELVKDALTLLREKECRIVFLEVRPSNVSAIRLYEQFGFRSFAIRRNYYDKPIEDALIMQLLLV